MADVQGCPVHRFEVTNSAALGAALRAAQGYLRDAGEEASWEAVVEGLAAPIPGSVIEPAPGTAEVYAEMVEMYAEAERNALGCKKQPEMNPGLLHAGTGSDGHR